MSHDDLYMLLNIYNFGFTNKHLVLHKGFQEYCGLYKETTQQLSLVYRLKCWMETSKLACK